MSNILLLEDDLSLINGLSFALRKQGYGLEVARTIKEVDTVWAEGKYDLLILDVSLPDGSGFEICEKVRQTSKVPIIFLTASDEEVNIIMGLDMGGDDYITKPFKLGVLLSRINALLRRVADFSQTETEIHSNGLKAILTQGKVYKNGELLDLTAGEYKLLCLFMQNPGTVLSKEQILEKLWDQEGNYIDNNTLNVYIRRLRTKVENNPKILRHYLSECPCFYFAIRSCHRLYCGDLTEIASLHFLFFLCLWDVEFYFSAYATFISSIKSWKQQWQK